MENTNLIKQEIVKDNYAVYNGDCMEVLPNVPNNSIDLIIYSPPFAGLYNYSSDYRDFSNCSNKEEFLKQYEYLVKELSRVTKKGRINAVHVTEVVGNNGNSWDFPHEVIKLHQENGFAYKGRITVWKDPLQVRMRTMLKSLTHKLIVEDSTQCFPAQPDYILLFKKNGESETPVTNLSGLRNYYGETPILPHMLKAWNNANGTKFNEDQLWKHLQNEKEEGRITKMNHYIWQRYASPLWDDIRINNVLPFRDSKEEDDEKHVHPLQLDVIDRLVDLYSNPLETILTPFMGVGSEVYSSVSLGRKAIGIELKGSYFKQAKINLEKSSSRFNNFENGKLF